MNITSPLRGSFRDPAGTIVIINGRVFRLVRSEYKDVVSQFLDSEFCAILLKDNLIPKTWVADCLPDILLSYVDTYDFKYVLEHRIIPFPVYPHEWIPSMLYDAGMLTIKLAQDALLHGWVLKDATPWNVLFSKGNPIFCDFLSFQPMVSTSIWYAYSQFQRTFILPLYANRMHGWSVHSLFLSSREGIDPVALARSIKGFRRIAPFELQLILFPAYIASRRTKGTRAFSSSLQGVSRDDIQLSSFILDRTFNRLRKQLEIVQPRKELSSQWTNYESEITHYNYVDHQAKMSFVSDAINELNPRAVLDLGSNSGEYSVLAAKNGAFVVAADNDVGALERLYKRIKTQKLEITPVVLNIARPTPAVGWRNSEVDSFIARATNAFDLIFALALIHHLLVTERVPVVDIIDMLYSLNAKHIIIEWVGADDEKFREISATHGNIYQSFTVEYFEGCLSQRFFIVRQQVLSVGSRIIYLCLRKDTI